MHCSQAWFPVAKKAPVLHSVTRLDSAPLSQNAADTGYLSSPSAQMYFLKVCKLLKVLSGLSTDFWDYIYSFGTVFAQTTA